MENGFMFVFKIKKCANYIDDLSCSFSLSLSVKYMRFHLQLMIINQDHIYCQVCDQIISINLYPRELNDPNVSTGKPILSCQDKPSQVIFIYLALLTM